MSRHPMTRDEATAVWIIAAVFLAVDFLRRWLWRP